VGIQWDLNLTQHIISCCTLFVARHLALTAAFSHFALCDTLPFGRLWYDTPVNAIGYAMHTNRSHHAVIRMYDETGNVIETHELGRRFRFFFNSACGCQRIALG